MRNSPHLEGQPCLVAVFETLRGSRRRYESVPEPTEQSHEPATRDQCGRKPLWLFGEVLGTVGLYSSGSGHVELALLLATLDVADEDRLNEQRGMIDSPAPTTPIIKPNIMPL